MINKDFWKVQEQHRVEVLNVRPLPNILNPLIANPKKCSNTLKLFFSSRQRIVLVCLTILYGWRLKFKHTGTIAEALQSLQKRPFKRVPTLSTKEIQN